MEVATKSRTESILTIMNIVTWIAFIGLLIKTGGTVISYAVSIYNPEAAKSLYKGLNLYELSQVNFWYYTMSVSFIVALSGMKAYVAHLLTKTLKEVSISNPFKTAVAVLLEKISHIILGLWIVSMLYGAHGEWLLKETGARHGGLASGEYLFVAGIVFVMAQIFKRGVELQSENDLTV